MDGKKLYSIQINGIQESINAVDSLVKQLNTLEQKINALSSSSVKINSGGGSKSSSKSSLSEEEKLERQIEQIDAKRVAYSKDIYQNYLAAKDVLKETVADQKQLAAAERIAADAYSNTMQGMKDKLADLKSVHFTTDISTDEFKKQTKEINEITEALKVLEKEYGVYSREVGHYENAANGFKKLQVEVAGTVHEFDNAKQAAVTLKKELATLQAKKDQGMLLSEDELKRFEELPEVVAQLKSSIQDAGKPMDNLMDTMQSFVAIAQTYKGLGAFFGIDDDKLQRSIQKLVGLQNAMQGIQKIASQMQSTEFLGGWVSKGSNAIDKIVDSIFGVEKASKAATVATNSLKVALKGIGIGIIIACVIELIDLLETWSEKQDEAAKAAEEAAEKVQKAVDEQRQAYVNASASYMNTASRLSYLQTEYRKTNDALRKTNIIREAAAEFKKLGMSVKNLNDAQRIFVQDGDKVIQLLKLQGDAAAISALRMEAFKKSFQMLLENGYDVNAASILAGSNKTVVELDKRLGKVTDQINTIKGKLKIGVDDVGKGVSDAIKKTSEEITRLELRLMREGLNKKLRQLDIEENKLIEEIKKNGKNTAEQIKAVQEKYAQLRIKEIDEYLKTIKEKVKKTAQDIADFKFELNIESLENQIENLENLIANLPNKATSNFQVFIPSRESKGMFKQLLKDQNFHIKLQEINANKEKLLNAQRSKNYEELYNSLTNWFNSIGKLQYQSLGETQKKVEDFVKYFKDGNIDIKTTALQMQGEFERMNKDLIIYFDAFGTKPMDSLDQQLDRRLGRIEDYNKTVLNEQKKYYDEQLKLQEINANQENLKAKAAELKRRDALLESMLNEKAILEEDIKKFNARTDAEKKALQEMKDNLETINNQMIQVQEDSDKKSKEIQNEYYNRLKNTQLQFLQKRTELTNNYFDKVQDSLSEFLTSVNDLLNSSTRYNNWNIVNLSQTHKNLDEAKAATQKALNDIDDYLIKAQMLYRMGLITPEAKDAINKQLLDLKRSFNLTLADIEAESKQAFPKFMQSIMQYVQGTADMIQSMFELAWANEDAAFDEEQEQLEKQNEAIEDALSKQEDIVKQHKSAIDDIESELASARGARRQHLIDQINAEIAAQRAAAKEQEKLEKKKQANEDKQKDLDKKRRKEQQNRDVISAIISTALATANALATQPFIPTGLAMGSLAAALGAVQIAIIKSQKYKEGGIIDGKSHSQGGVKVFGGRAELEGGEMIVNKTTTMQNVEVLEYINSKKKRMSLDDFIEFYTSGKLKSNIKSISPSSKYVEGGQLTLDTSNVNINDRLLDAFESYSKRPMYVSVVDIQNKMDDVNSVKALAGIR